jgi:hypothetical protein
LAAILKHGYCYLKLLDFIWIEFLIYFNFLPDAPEGINIWEIFKFVTIFDRMGAISSARGVAGH